MRICVWSGPRNLSTALMYSFAARGDCAVMDEPFYAAWLDASGAPHPMRDEILAAAERDPAAISAACAAEPAEGHVYQKHMAHHMRPEFDRGFMAGAANVILIRHPARVLASYHDRHENPSLEEIGIEAQLMLWEEARALGPAPVIDSADIRADPAGTLAALCEEIGLEWRPEMLRWPAGGHRADGVWARHWYASVHRSTGFAGAEGPMPALTPRLASLAEVALPLYDTLKAHRIAPRT